MGYRCPCILNHYVNFGWEYVYHCHMLAHEEMDMMHGTAFAVPPLAPSNLGAAVTSSTTLVLNWNDNSRNETGFTVERSNNGGATWATLATTAAGATTYTDTSYSSGPTLSYRVFAANTVGDAATPGFPVITAKSGYSNVVTGAGGVGMELAVFQPGGTWFIDTNVNGIYNAGTDWTNSPNTFGRTAGDVPLAIDWDGDGRRELAIFRPGGTWFIDVNHNGAYEFGVDWTNSPSTFGRNAGDVPVAVDWDGNGRQELAIFRPGGTWFIDVNHNGAYEFGVDWTNSPNTFGRNAGDVPVAIDWDGNGRQELAIFRPGGTWFIDLNHSGSYQPGLDWTNSPSTLGRTAGDIPVAIDWDGNGTQELAIFRRSTGAWYIDLNRNGAFNPGADPQLGPFGNFAGALPIAINGW